MFLETVSLILKHSDISTATTSTASSNIGSWSNNKQITTWRFNLRNLLGNEMYDNNDMFILRLNQLSYSLVNFPLVASKDQQVVINLSGLNFINSTYNVASGNSTGKHQMLLLNMGTSGGVESYPPNIAMCNFAKSQDNVELTIELIRTVDNLPPQTSSTFPAMAYSFDIYPVKKIYIK
jgi:hypothetical protein